MLGRCGKHQEILVNARLEFGMAWSRPALRASNAPCSCRGSQKPRQREAANRRVGDAGRSGRGLQSRDAAPKISAFMKFAGESGIVFRPSGERWAFVFLGEFCPAGMPFPAAHRHLRVSVARIRNRLLAHMPRVNVRPTKRWAQRVSSNVAPPSRQLIFHPFFNATRTRAQRALLRQAKAAPPRLTKCASQNSFRARRRND